MKNIGLAIMVSMLVLYFILYFTSGTVGWLGIFVGVVGLVGAGMAYKGSREG